MRYDAFISYSHAADSELAAALQRALTRFAKPWYRRRALNVFRDATNLAASPSLWASVETALSQSRWLLLMASPESAASPWVRREVEWWLAHRSPETLLIVLTAGGLHWREAAHCFDSDVSTALPSVLHEGVATEPLYVDLRWARGAGSSSLGGARFRAAVLDIASPLHERPKDELDGDDLRQHRRTLRLAIGGATALVLTTVGTALSGWLAFLQRDEARAQAAAALAGRLSAQVQSSESLAPALIDRNTLLAAEAVQRAPSSEAIEALRDSLRLKPLPLGRIVHAYAPRSASLSRDGARVAVAAEAESMRQWIATVHDVASGHELLRVVQPRRIEGLWLTHDAAHLLLHLSGIEDDRGHRAGPDELAVWSMATQSEQHRLQAKRELQALATSLADPALVALASEGVLTVVSLSSGRTLAEHRHAEPITALALDASGAIIALDRRARLLRWDWAGGRDPLVAPSPLPAAADTAYAALAPDGRTLAWRDREGRMRHTSLSAPSATPRNAGTAAIIHSLGVAAPGLALAGRWVASLGGDRTARVWDAVSAREVARFAEQEFSALAISADGRTIVVGGTGDSGGLLTSVPPLYPAGPWTAVAMTNLTDHPSMVGTTWVMRLGRGDALASLDTSAPVSAVALDYEATRLLATTGVHPLWGRIEVHGPAHRTAGQILADLMIWLTADGRSIARHRLTGNLVAAALAPDGRTAASLSAEGQLVLVNPTIHANSASAAPASESRVIADVGKGAQRVVFSTDGRRVGASGQGGATVIDLSSGERLFEARAQWHVIGFDFALSRALLVEPDARQVTARRIELSDGREIGRVMAHFALGEAATALDATLARAVVGDSSFSGAGFQLFDTGSGIQTFAVPDAHTQPITASVFTPDGAYLATASLDGTVRIWSLRERREHSRLKFDAPVLSIQFSGDGRWLAVGTESGEASVLPWREGDLVAHACQRMTRSLTEAEWRQFMPPTVAYRSLCPSGPDGPALLKAARPAS